MSELFDLSGKTAFVTGSNRGIGKALILGLAQNGADVILHCRKPNEEADDVISQAVSMGRKVKAVYADLSDVDSAQSIYSQINNDFKLPDIVILNASIQVRNNWLDITDDEFDMQMNVNFRSSLKLAQLFVPHMKQNNWGRLITIGSVQQIKPHNEMLVYAASKMAQMSMVTSIATLLAPYGITVNNIAPGTIYTDRNKEVLADKEYYEKVKSGIPVNFIGEPIDCVGATLMLCGESGRFITGENIYIDGGKHL